MGPKAPECRRRPRLATDLSHHAQEADPEPGGAAIHRAHSNNRSFQPMSLCWTAGQWCLRLRYRAGFHLFSVPADVSPISGLFKTRGKVASRAAPCRMPCGGLSRRTARVPHDCREIRERPASASDKDSWKVQPALTSKVLGSK